MSDFLYNWEHKDQICISIFIIEKKINMRSNKETVNGGSETDSQRNKITSYILNNLEIYK